MTMAQEKKKARRILRSRLRKMTDAAIFRQSYAACLKLCAIETWREARTVMLYLPMHRETDPTAAILDALRLNKRVCVPRIVPESRRLELVCIETLNAEMAVEANGIREPVGGAVIQPEDLDLIVVPGLGFNGQGGRLGRGGGFYDILLDHPNNKAVRCGLAFHQQILEPLPLEAHDQLVHQLITDRTCYSVDTIN